MTDLHPNARRVADAARELGLDIDVRTFPAGTKTAADAAAAIGVEVGQIVKSLIFAVDGEVVVAYVSGANQLDEKKLAAAAGGAKAGRVDADVVRQATGYPIGGVPPVRPRHAAAGLRGRGPAGVRRRVGGRRHLERRVRADAGRPRAGVGGDGHRPPARLRSSRRRRGAARYIPAEDLYILSG